MNKMAALFTVNNFFNVCSITFSFFFFFFIILFLCWFSFPLCLLTRHCRSLAIQDHELNDCMVCVYTQYIYSFVQSLSRFFHFHFSMLFYFLDFISFSVIAPIDHIIVLCGAYNEPNHKSHY